MRTDQLTSLAAAIVVGGGTLLAASGADASLSINGMSLQGASLNGVFTNGTPLNGAAANAVASRGFDFNNVAVVSWTWECPLPLDRGKAVFCAIGTSPGREGQ